MKQLTGLFAVAFAVTFSGCAIFGTMEGRITPPTLLEKPALPVPPHGSKDLFLKTELLIAKDGSVKRVCLLNSSGDPAWDSAAAGIIERWKYSPPLDNNVPVQMRIIQVAHVIANPPIMVHLAQMVFLTESQADSIKAILKAGASFDSLAQMNSLPNSTLRGGDLGEIDVHTFPQDIQSDLVGLRPGQVSRILPLGPYYAIFKRLD